MAKLQKASIPPYLPSPPRLSAPPSSTPPRLALPYTTSSSSTSYPGNHIPPPSSYPSTSSSKTMIPSYTSKPDTYNSLLTPAPSRRLPPTPDQLERVDRHLKAKDKTAVSCLFEWCQYTKYYSTLHSLLPSPLSPITPPSSHLQFLIFITENPLLRKSVLLSLLLLAPYLYLLCPQVHSILLFLSSIFILLYLFLLILKDNNSK